MKGFKIAFLCFLFSNLSLAQKDSELLNKLKKLKPTDELIIDYSNMGCFTNQGERLVISIDGKKIQVLRFENFHRERTLDSKVLTDVEKQNLMIQANEFKSQIISFKKFQKSLKKLKKIINAGNDPSHPRIGERTKLSVQLNDENLLRYYKDWINLEHMFN